MGWRCFLLAAVYLLSAADILAQSSATARTLAVDDLFKLEDLPSSYGGSVAVSRDGSIALARTRPAVTWTRIKHDFLYGGGESDVWVQLKAGGALRRITNGERDSTGWFSPQWSPDGRHLVMLSTRGAASLTDHVWLWVWDGVSRTLRRLGSLPLFLTGLDDRPFTWVGSDKLLVRTMDVTRPNLLVDMDATQKLAPAVWELGAKGELSRSVLDTRQASGVPSKAAFVHIDGREEPLPFRSISHLTGTENGHFAFLSGGNVGTQRDRPLDWNARTPVRLTVCTPKCEQIPPSAPNVNIDPGTITWSADGSRIAFVEVFPDGSRHLAVLHGAERLNFLADELAISPSRPPAPPGPNFLPSSAPVLWITNEEMLVRTSGISSGLLDWWSVSRTRRPVRIASAPEKVPDVIWGMADGSFLGQGSDGVVSLQRTEGRWLVTRALPDSGASIRWPGLPSGVADAAKRADLSSDVRMSHFFYQARDGALMSNELGHAAARIPGCPTGDGLLFLGGNDMSTAVAMTRNRNGLHVWRISSIACEEIFAANGFVGEIAEARHIMLGYTSKEGARLQAALFYPANFDANRSYPIIVKVYPNMPVTEATAELDGLGYLNHLSPQIFAAQGFFVLIPSMPISYVRGAEPMRQLQNGVIPALDAAERSAPIDRRREYLLGQSFGGYSVYALVTQTNRFRAAVAMAGLTDLTSLYGEFDARRRYDSDLLSDDNYWGTLESYGAIHLGTTPFESPEKYSRNSPISFASRVQTPLLLIHGDMDGISMTQAEEFYSALKRQSKEARFVRYFGEGHVAKSPAAIRDQLKEIFSWFEKH